MTIWCSTRNASTVFSRGPRALPNLLASTRRLARKLLFTAGLAVLVVGCSRNGSYGGSGGAGGSGTGGEPGTSSPADGGHAGSGGGATGAESGSGGDSGVGGKTGSGGSAASGGSAGSGSGSAGSGGSPASGGKTGSGGSAGSGGSPGSGGSAGSGTGGGNAGSDGSGALWEPTDLGKVVWHRPTGAGFVTWESLVTPAVANAQKDSPQTPVILTATFMKAMTGNQVLTLPTGIFEAENGFSNYVNDNMIAIGSGYAEGLRGIAGSGSHSTPGTNGAETIVRMHGTLTGSPGQTPQGNLIIANHVTNPYFAGFSLEGVQTRGDNVFHAGIMLNSCSGKPVIERMYLRNASPGYGNSPPGETFGINVYKTPNAVIRDTEIDGRDLAGNRTCASPIGWNNVVNDTSTVNVQRVYTHHGLTGMLTFWETTNLITEDYYTYSWSWGTGTLSGSGINHEQSGGRIRHLRPRLFVNGAKSNGPIVSAYGHPAGDDTPTTMSNGATFALQSGLGDAGADFEIIEPQWDNTLGTSGIICMASHDGYALGQQVSTAPKISLKDSQGADYLLVKIDHPNPGWNTADPKVDYAWFTTNLGREAKCPLRQREREGPPPEM